MTILPANWSTAEEYLCCNLLACVGDVLCFHDPVTNLSEWLVILSEWNTKLAGWLNLFQTKLFWTFFCLVQIIFKNYLDKLVPHLHQLKLSEQVINVFRHQNIQWKFSLCTLWTSIDFIQLYLILWKKKYFGWMERSTENKLLYIKSKGRHIWYIIKSI